MTWTPLPERLDDLERRIIAAFPDTFDMTGGCFVAVDTGIGADLHRVVCEAKYQDTTMRGVFLARAMANVAEELLGRVERTLAEIAAMDAWMDAEVGRQ